MAWTYDDDLPTSLDKVRFLCGDTNTNQQLLQDGEIAYLLTTYGTPMSAAAWACRAIAAKYAREVHEEVGDLKLYNEQMSLQYLALADSLEARAALSAVPTAGGIYVADKDAQSSDTSLVSPNITIGMHDFK